MKRVRRTVSGLALLLIAVAAALLLRHSPPPDSTSGLSAGAAGESAQALFNQGRFYELLPYASRLAALGADRSFDFHARLAVALQNAAVESRARDGVLSSRARSSIERIGLIRRAVSELDRADALAPDSLRAATVAMTRAELLGAWGFPRESYRELTRASRLSPLDAKATSEAAWLEAMFKDPTQAIPPPPGSEAMPRR